MIKHSVIFKLKNTIDPTQQGSFFSAAGQLSAIPGVLNFEIHLQVSPKNNYEYGISMEFASQSDYDQYNNHPAHQAFIEKYWLTCVAEFLEIDYEPFQHPTV